MTCNLIAAMLLLGTLACGESTDAPQLFTIVSDDRSDLPLHPLARVWRDRFIAGDEGFEHVFRPSEGLGPVYIRSACAACHTQDGKGPGFVTKMAVLSGDGTPLDFLSQAQHLPYGPTERPRSVGDVRPVLAPEGVAGLHLSQRVGPAVFARGFMEAVQDGAIIAQQSAQAQRDDGIHGRVNWVDRVSEANPETRFHTHAPKQGPYVGRFGVKARLASIDDFVADAYQGDMGLTSPLRPLELDNPDHAVGDGIDLDVETVNLVSDYVRLTALPRRRLPPGRGAELFAATRCAVCHVPSLPTRADYPVPNLAGIDAPLFTDMLLHDMGSDLADGVREFQANGRQWRTAPLIGLRHMHGFLHDGRAASVRDAVRLHAGPGSEATDSVGRFDALDSLDQNELLTYVEAL